MTLPTADTIAAAATPQGSGALGIVRISGPEAFKIADTIWKGAPLSKAISHTVHLGNITDEDGHIIDQAIATVFRAPRSFTGEDSLELTLHGSPWIIRQVVNLLLRKGCRAAQPGEFTQRAYLNGRMDLASAEGVADLISSSSRAAHRLAMEQTRGAFSNEFNTLRSQLIELASLLELELDFSEEDVEFADRSRLLDLTARLSAKIDRLTKSYTAGRAFKEGVPVVIAGIPNVGKSTLLNALLEEDKAIVSDIPGTTRDIIEDTAEIEGILFRFIDTAGLRESDDSVEKIGIGRARQRLAKAAIILWLLDTTQPIAPQLNEMRASLPSLSPSQTLIPVFTKSAISPPTDLPASLPNIDGKPIKISAAEGLGLPQLHAALKEAATTDFNPDSELLLTNARHYGDLLQASQALARVQTALNANLSADLIAIDIREAISHLESLTGSITTPDLLTSIFSKFCIGK